MTTEKLVTAGGAAILQQPAGLRSAQTSRRQEMLTEFCAVRKERCWQNSVQ